MDQKVQAVVKRQDGVGAPGKCPRPEVSKAQEYVGRKNLGVEEGD